MNEIVCASKMIFFFIDVRRKIIDELISSLKAAPPIALPYILVKRGL